MNKQTFVSSQINVFDEVEGDAFIAAYVHTRVLKQETQTQVNLLPLNHCCRCIRSEKLQFYDSTKIQLRNKTKMVEMTWSLQHYSSALFCTLDTIFSLYKLYIWGKCLISSFHFCKRKTKKKNSLKFLQTVSILPHKSVAC